MRAAPPDSASNVIKTITKDHTKERQMREKRRRELCFFFALSVWVDIVSIRAPTPNHRYLSTRLSSFPSSLELPFSCISFSFMISSVHCQHLPYFSDKSSLSAERNLF